MDLIAILSDREDDLLARLKGLLGEYTTYPVRSLDELVNLQHNIPVNLLIIDTSSYRFSSLSDFIKKLDDEKVVILPGNNPIPLLNGNYLHLFMVWLISVIL